MYKIKDHVHARNKNLDKIINGLEYGIKHQFTILKELVN
jgi:hypothetical protein